MERYLLVDHVPERDPTTVLQRDEPQPFLTHGLYRSVSIMDETRQSETHEARTHKPTNV